MSKKLEHTTKGHKTATVNYVDGRLTGISIQFDHEVPCVLVRSGRRILELQVSAAFWELLENQLRYWLQPEGAKCTTS